MPQEVSLLSSAARAVWSFLKFAVRLTSVHIVTYVVVGAISYWLVAQKYWVGPEKVPGLNNPTGEFVQRWMLPAQILRGFIYAVTLYPLRRALLEMGRWGGLVLASPPAADVTWRLSGAAGSLPSAKARVLRPERR